MVAGAKWTCRGDVVPASVLPRRRCVKVSVSGGLVKGWLVVDGSFFPSSTNQFISTLDQAGTYATLSM